MVRAIFPGTFDPIHYGHIDIARRASRLFDELIIAVYDKPLKNLVFSPEERLHLVRQTFTGEPKIRVMGAQATLPCLSPLLGAKAASSPDTDRAFLTRSFKPAIG